MQKNPSLANLTCDYDAFIVDLWGVVHDGTSLYPHARESLLALKAAGKRIIFLSNAPRRAAKARKNLDVLGITHDMYDGLMTSGEAAYLHLADNTGWLGTRYYYLGPSKDEDVLSDLPSYIRIEDPSAAHFILNTGFEQDFQPEEAILPTLSLLNAFCLPLVCINPDMEVVKRDGTHMLCAGVVAAQYESFGGTVHRIGKPYINVYEHCLAMLGAVDPSRILAIGDTPATDILGANRAGIDALLITGGVLSAHYPEGINEAEIAIECDAAGATARYVMDAFALI